MLDSALRNDLTVDEALALGRRAILAAAHRDAYSGGSINCIFSPDSNIICEYDVDLCFSISCY